MSSEQPLPISLDQILGGRLTLAQPRDGYRAAIDPVLLAAAVPAAAGERVLDLGCGVGTAGLCVVRRVEGCHVMGIDVQPALIELAQRNARDNALADRATFHVGDVLHLTEPAFDHVLANPPYLERARASVSPNPIKALANVEGDAMLKDWVVAASTAVKPGGSITFIHRADRAEELRAEMGRGLGRLHLRPLLPKEGMPAKRILLQGIRGAPAGFEILPPLVLHEASGGFTEAAEAILRRAAAFSMMP
ncbi:tRNA1(Val) (adenine(37)-N6)-methyltransferase [Dongia sp.]|uniref:tRNA1(Val) (adenine(37)-N6)-methyltransferase n=1 Tax=Dongia sp. TaxID=1977262 RepID=UPI0035B40A14